MQSCCSADSQGCTAELHIQHGNTAQGQDRTSGLLQTLHHCHIVPLYLTIGVATCVCPQLPSTDVHAPTNHTLIWLCLKIFYFPDFKAFKILLKQCMQSRLQLLSLTFPYLKSKWRKLGCLAQEQAALKVHLQGCEDLRSGKGNQNLPLKPPCISRLQNCNRSGWECLC